VRRLLYALAALAVLYFTVEGGEFGTSDLVRQRARRRALEARVSALRAEVRDLRSRKKAVQTDPETQERIAREEFGMVRGDRELLYRFTPSADSAEAADSVRTHPDRP